MWSCPTGRITGKTLKLIISPFKCDTSLIQPQCFQKNEHHVFFFLHLMLWKVISSCHHLYYRSYKQSLPHQPLFLLMKKKKNLCYQKKQKMHSPEDTWTELWLCGASTIQLPVNEELISKLNCIRMSITINLWFDLQELLS